MSEAIERAHASEHWDRRASTLKIFLAPEFYWRGAKGAYRLSEHLARIATPIAEEIVESLSAERFKHWFFVLGTIVAAQMADEAFVKMSKRPFNNISYYNFATIHLGGTKRSFSRFKHYISSIDFLQATPDSMRYVAPPPGLSQEFCKLHPESNGCIYYSLPPSVLSSMGFRSYEILHDGLLEVGGVKIGLEICLDHAKGDLCRTLGENGAVDVQLVVSAGMNIRSGPVCTFAGSPVFLADGFARTEMNLNAFGRGREGSVSDLPEMHSQGYNVGIVYGADALIALQQWLSEAIKAITGNAFGTHVAGVNTMPAGSEATGATGVGFHQVSALGSNWFDKLDGFYNTANFMVAGRVQNRLENALENFTALHQVALRNKVSEVMAEPTVDIYGPLPLPRKVASAQTLPA
eukprot:TRINITY_DN28920_c0_g1_i2.p1 TRINITY_DN28920_c0_g1~~TRINITY_DN28920_c0_g1_i2.p1  ORF type:complete len:407 (-),score=54.27 TRINITY_DN28920_c0_g1_i2:513-1733(-)